MRTVIDDVVYDTNNAIFIGKAGNESLYIGKYGMWFFVVDEKIQQATEEHTIVWLSNHSPTPCKEGCENCDKPYCHCVDCGETGIFLNEDGICINCLYPDTEE